MSKNLSGFLDESMRPTRAELKLLGFARQIWVKKKDEPYASPEQVWELSSKKDCFVFIRGVKKAYAMHKGIIGSGFHYMNTERFIKEVWQ